MKIKDFIKESARDLIALGSWIFFIIVVVRIYLLSNYSYLSQFIVGALVFFPLIFLFGANMYAGLGLIILIFTTLFYNNLNFTIFGIFIYLLLLVSLIFLKYDKMKVLKGVLFGLAATGISYYVVNLIF